MGEKCSNEVPTNASHRPRPQNKKGPGGISTVAIAGTVAGIVLAALICCVVLVAAVVCVRLRRKRRTQSKYYITSPLCIIFRKVVTTDSVSTDYGMNQGHKKGRCMILCHHCFISVFVQHLKVQLQSLKTCH